MWPTAPGRWATQVATMIIQSMPAPISRHSGPSKPNGTATRASRPAGIDSAEITGIANRLASTP
jgi:hypothetical protein